MGVGAVAGEVTLAMSWNSDREVLAVRRDGGTLRLGDAGMFPALPVFDGRTGWGIDIGWLHRFDVDRGIVASIPVLGDDGGGLRVWEPFLLDDGSALVLARSELRRYRADGTLEWRSALAEPLPDVQPATALGPGVLYLWRAWRVLEAYELPVVPAEHGWASQRGSRCGGSSEW